MGLFDQFPYTNFHELNLDWLIERMKHCLSVVDGINANIDAAVEREIEKLVETGEFEQFLYNMFKEHTDNAVLWGADPAGVDDSSVVINKMLSTIGSCYLPNGIYRIDESIVIPSDARLYGQSTDGVILKAYRNGPVAVIKSATYDLHHNTDTINGDTSFEIKDLTVDGNGRGMIGIALYGYKFHIANVDIRKCTDGFYSEWGSSNGFAENGNVMHSVIENVTIGNCTSHVAQFFGPHDSYIDKLVGHNCVSGLYIVKKASNANRANGTVLSNSHIFSIQQTGIYITDYCYLDNVVSESNGGDGIYAESECKMYNCTIFNNGGNGLTIAANISQAIVENASCYQNTGKDIVIGANVKNSIINAQTFSADSGKIAVNSGLLTKEANSYNNHIHIVSASPFHGIDYAPMALSTVEIPETSPYVNNTGRSANVIVYGSNDCKLLFTGSTVNMNAEQSYPLPCGASITWTTKPSTILLMYNPIN